MSIYLRLRLYSTALVPGTALAQRLAQGWRECGRVGRWYKIEREEPLPAMAVKFLEKELEREHRCHQSG